MSGRSRPTLRSLGNDHLTTTASIEFPRGSGLQRSDYAQLCGKICQAQWQPGWGATPALGHLLDAEQADHATKVLCDQTSLIADCVRAGATTVDRVYCELILTGRPTRKTEFGERVASAIGTFVLDHGVLPGPDDQRRIAARIVAAMHSKPVLLSPAEFATRCHSDYDQQWSTSGAARLAALPPSRIGLGSDVQPPLITARHRGIEHNWRLGTDRSVYDRYALYARRPNETVPENVTLPDRRPTLDNVTTSAPFDAEVRADIEVQRACECLGLARTEHHSALIAAATAASASPPAGLADPDTVVTWSAWREADVLLADDTWESDLVEGFMQVVASSVQRHRAPRVAPQDLAAQVADSVTHDEAGSLTLVDIRNPGVDPADAAVAQALVRKLWMGLLAWEQQTGPPIRSRDLVGLVNAALQYAVPEALRIWAVEGRSEPNTARLNATIILVHHDRDLAATIAADSTGMSWAGVYEGAASKAAGAAWAEVYLRVDELAEYLRGNASDEGWTDEH